MSMLENYRRKLQRARKKLREKAEGREVKRLKVRDPDGSEKKK